MAPTVPTPHAEHVRQRLLHVVRADPGIHVRRLSLVTGMSWNACLHHLRTLEAAGVLVSRKVGSRVCWYDSSDGAFRHKTAAALLRDRHNLRVARAVSAEPGQSQSDLAQRLGCAASSVHRRVSRLERAGLLRRTVATGARHVFPTDQLGDLARRAGVELPAHHVPSPVLHDGDSAAGPAVADPRATRPDPSDGPPGGARTW